MTDDKVVTFGKKEKPPEYLRNKAKCLTCRHEWHAVAVVGTTWLECPACQLLMGRFIGPVGHKGYTYDCKCGNDLFIVAADFYLCPCCGTEHAKC